MSPVRPDSKDLWDGDAGSSCFLDQIVSPSSTTTCAPPSATSVVRTWSALRPGAEQVQPRSIRAGRPGQRQPGQDREGRRLDADLGPQPTLGGDYFQTSSSTWPRSIWIPDVQKAISTAQASFADVSQAQAELKKAQIEAQANAAKQRGLYLVPGVCPAGSAGQAAAGHYRLRARQQLRHQPGRASRVAFGQGQAGGDGGGEEAVGWAGSSSSSSSWPASPGASCTWRGSGTSAARQRRCPARSRHRPAHAGRRCPTSSTRRQAEPRC